MAEGLGAERAVPLPPICRAMPACSRVRSAFPPAPRTGCWPGFDRALGGRERFDLLRLAGGQTAPMLVLHDPEDREVPFADGRRWRMRGRARGSSRWRGRDTPALSAIPGLSLRAIGFVSDADVSLSA